MKIKGKDPFILGRTQAYIGVLIDDLVTKGTDEPYRMFTSRAEYRILLRQDNADVRLTPLAYSIGMASEERMRRVERKMSWEDKLSSVISDVSVSPSDVNDALSDRQSAQIQQKVKLQSLLLRPELSLADLKKMSAPLSSFIETIPEDIREEVCESSEILIKYSRYIEKEREVVSRILKYENLPIKPDLDYRTIEALSFEAREKLSAMRPKTIGQASRISGVSPADISVLLILMNE